jgi:serine/threonine-protein kinase
MSDAVLRFGRFRADALLGPGGVTETYRARDEAERAAALKLLRADRGGDAPDVSAAFVAAARRLQAVDLPGVVAVQEVSQGPEEIFAISPLVEGPDLAQLCAKRGGAVDVETAARVALGVAQRLRALHEAPRGPFVHGSLCPGNVRLDAAGEVLLLDAGLTAAIRGLTAHPVEKWLFAAPEVIAGKAPTIASDLYSLGVLLYFLSTGRPPLEAETVDELRAAMAEGVPPLAAAPALMTPMRKLVAFLPAARFASAAEVAAELESVLKRVRVAPPPAEVRTPPPESVPPPSGRARQKEDSASSRTLRVRPITIVLAALGVVGGGLWLSRDREIAQPAASQPSPVSAPIAEPAPAAPTASGPRPLAALPPLPEADKETVFKVFTRPDEAAVWIDGIERGPSPVEVALKPGQHRVALVKEGYATHRQTINVPADLVLALGLKPARRPPGGGAIVAVLCRTPGKYPVQIDGEEIGRLCPVQSLQLPPGPHKIGIFVPGADMQATVEREITTAAPVRIAFPN